MYGAPQPGYQSSGYQSSGYYGDQSGGAMGLENNPNVSSSQRSSLEDARKDYQEAQAEVANDSDPSSSDVEDLQEAREDYQEEIDDAEDEAYDD